MAGSVIVEKVVSHIQRFFPLKFQILKTIRQATLIFIMACCLGLIVNMFHPKGVKITSKRASLKFAADTVLAKDLPDVSVIVDGVKTNETKNETMEPLLITTAQVLQLKQSEQVLILDARTKTEFIKAHIPGALNLPFKNLTEYKTKIDSLPQDIWLVCYCDGPPCDQSELLAHELMIAGYVLVAIYDDGLKGWKKSGNEIEGKETAKNEK